jgi:pimeloyl-ACP methyl ester carboxylesterase
VHLVGASYGATLALHAAQADPGSLRSLALYKPPLFASGDHLNPVLQQYRARLDAGDVACATMLFLQQVSNVPPVVLAALASASSAEPDPREATRSAVGSLQDLEALAQDSPDIHRWASIELPTLLMQGSDTRDPMPATMAALAEALPRAERVTWSEQCTSPAVPHRSWWRTPSATS